MWKTGVIKLADSSFSILYHIGSLALAVMIHETYYYWTHRAMHHKKLYRLFHKGHHDSIEVSSWTSFAFDPLETIVQIVPFFIIVYFYTSSPLRVNCVFDDDECFWRCKSPKPPYYSQVYKANYFHPFHDWSRASLIASQGI